MKQRIVQVDAFADRAFAGNPAAVCVLDAARPDAWMQNVAQGWLVLELTDSAFMLGLVGFAGSFPWLVLLLVGGVYADRLDRRRLLIRANVAMMAAAAVLTALTWTGAVRIWHVFAISLASGSAIRWPADRRSRSRRRRSRRSSTTWSAAATCRTRSRSTPRSSTCRGSWDRAWRG